MGNNYNNGIPLTKVIRIIKAVYDDGISRRGNSHAAMVEPLWKLIQDFALYGVHDDMFEEAATPSKG